MAAIDFYLAKISPSDTFGGVAVFRCRITLVNAMEIIEPISHIKICRDPDDDKFPECAKDANSLYIVSGDKDLLEIKDYKGIRILTAKDFCEKYLSE